MTHPTREDWMSYLYDELPANERSALESHLQSCAECRAQMSVWQTAGNELSAWQLPVRSRRRRAHILTRWAAAAALMALAIVGGAHLISLSTEVKELRTALQRTAAPDANFAAQISEQSTRAATTEAQSLMTALAQQWEEKRLADQQALLATLQKLNARHTQDYATLRKELETVAVFSEAGLQSAQNQISSLVITPTSISDAK